jgi:transcriptional regulator with XRE-family HTH domain
MASNVLKTFAQKVRTLRLQKGWSQEDLGRRAGLHRTYIGSIERHERNVSLLNVQRIAKALRVDIKDLL